MRHWLFASYVLVCMVALIWPLYAEFGARIEPFVFGLPFSFVWVIGWLALSFFALLAYHLRCATLERDDGGRE